MNYSNVNDTQSRTVSTTNVSTKSVKEEALGRASRTCESCGTLVPIPNPDAGESTSEPSQLSYASEASDSTAPATKLHESDDQDTRTDNNRVQRELVLKTLKKFDDLRDGMVAHNRERDGLETQEEKEAIPLISRPELAAVQQMKRDGLVLSGETVGKIPGLEVGDRFPYRASMVVIGLHGELRAGISKVILSLPGREAPRGGKDEPKSDRDVDDDDRHHVEIATSLVMNMDCCRPGRTRRYPDNFFRREAGTAIYSGAGNPRQIANKHEQQAADQKLTGGNLALYNSFERAIPIRLVIRWKDPNNAKGKAYYEYVGLYKTTEVKHEKGQLGNIVYKFHMQREPADSMSAQVNATAPPPLEDASATKKL